MPLLILPPEGVIELDPRDNAHPCAWAGTVQDGVRVEHHLGEGLVPDPHSGGVRVSVCRRHLGDLLCP